MTADEIRALRHRLGLNQSEFGALMGDVNQRTVSRWEVGTRRPNKFYRAILGMIDRNEQNGEYTPEFLARYTLDMERARITQGG